MDSGSNWKKLQGARRLQRWSREYEKLIWGPVIKKIFVQGAECKNFEGIKEPPMQSLRNRYLDNLAWLIRIHLRGNFLKCQKVTLVKK